MSPRPYHLGRRREHADQTHARILRAARTVLERSRDGRFTVDLVARRAGVARMTVYNQFGSLSGLLESMFDEIALPLMANRMPAVFREPDPVQALRLFASTFAALYASSPRLFARLAGFAEFDPTVAASLRAREQRRLLAARALLDKTWQGRLPAPWHSLDEAARALYSLTSFAAWHGLGAEDEPPDVAEERLIRIILALFAPGEPAG